MIPETIARHISAPVPLKMVKERNVFLKLFLSPLVQEDSKRIVNAIHSARPALDQWQSGKLGTGSCIQSVPRAFPSSTDVPVLLLNQPKNISLGPRKGGCVRLIEKTAVCILYLIKTYNRRQNVLRHFILNWIFLPFTDFKRGEDIFSSPDPLHAMLCRCSSYLQKTTNTPTLNGGNNGGVRILLFSEVTLFEYNV